MASSRQDAYLMGYLPVWFANMVVVAHMQLFMRDVLQVPSSTVGTIWMAFAVTSALAEVGCGVVGGMGPPSKWMVAVMLAVWGCTFVSLWLPSKDWPMPALLATSSTSLVAFGVAHAFVMQRWLGLFAIVFEDNVSRTRASSRKHIFSVLGLVSAMVLFPWVAGKGWTERRAIAAVSVAMALMLAWAAIPLLPVLCSAEAGATGPVAVSDAADPNSKGLSRRPSLGRLLTDYLRALRTALQSPSLQAFVASDGLQALATALVTSGFPLFARYHLRLSVDPAPFVYFPGHSVMVPPAMHLPILYATFYLVGMASSPVWVKAALHWRIVRLWQFTCFSYGSALFFMLHVADSLTTGVLGVILLGALMAGFMVFPDLLIARLVDTLRLHPGASDGETPAAPGKHLPSKSKTSAVVLSARAVARRLAAAIQGMVTGMVLTWSGYVPGGDSQAPPAMDAIYYIVALLPFLLLIGSGAALQRYSDRSHQE